MKVSLKLTPQLLLVNVILLLVFYFFVTKIMHFSPLPTIIFMMCCVVLVFIIYFNSKRLGMQYLLPRFLGGTEDIKELLLPGETLLKDYTQGFSVTRVGIGAQFLINQQLAITTKRIIFTKSATGYSVTSYFYQHPEEIRCDKLFLCTNFTIEEFWKEEGKFCFKYYGDINKVIIKTDYADEMYSLLKKNGAKERT